MPTRCKMPSARHRPTQPLRADTTGQRATIPPRPLKPSGLDANSLWMDTMNRCQHPPNRTRTLALCLLLSPLVLHAETDPVATTATATATATNVNISTQTTTLPQVVGPVRQFPPQALRGTLQVVQPPDILLDGQATRLSPGARIRNTQNTLALSASLVGQTWVVNYTREPLGLVHEVWILTPAEAALPRPRATP